MTVVHASPDLRTVYATHAPTGWPLAMLWEEATTSLTIGWFEPDLLLATPAEQANLAEVALFAFEKSGNYKTFDVMVVELKKFVTLW